MRWAVRLAISASAVAFAAFAAPAYADDCDQVKTWISAGPVPIPQFAVYGKASESVMELIRDARFSPVFGMTYDRMPPADVQRFSNIILPRCFAKTGPLGTLDPKLKDAAYSVFSSRGFGMNATQLAKSRVVAGNVGELTQEMERLQADEAGHARYMAIQESATGVLPGSTPDVRSAFTTALDRAELRVVIPVETARVNQAIAEASGYDGMTALAGIIASYQGENISAALRSAHEANAARLGARITQVAVPVAADERRRIDAIGDGADGLEQGVQWRRDYDSRLRPFAVHSPDIAALPAYLHQRRGPVLLGAQAPVRELILATRENQALRQVVSRFLLPTDESMPGGAALYEIASRQSEYLRKRDILGEDLDAERAARYLGTMGSAGAPAAMKRPLSDEPTSEDIYDALQGQYDIKADAERSMNNHCNRGGASADISSLVMCMGLGAKAMFGWDGRTEITRLRKIECVRASGKPGFVCDYEISRSGGELNAQGAVLNAALANGVREESRFVRSSDGSHWQLMAQDISE